jgi:hypothetical protein
MAIAATKQAGSENTRATRDVIVLMMREAMSDGYFRRHRHSSNLHRNRVPEDADSNADDEVSENAVHSSHSGKFSHRKHSRASMHGQHARFAK